MALKSCGTTIDVLLLVPESSWWFIWWSFVRSGIDAAIQLLQYFFCIMWLLLFTCAQLVERVGCSALRLLLMMMQAGLDPLMRTTLQTPPLSIAPTFVDTPTGESYTHVSLLFSVEWFEPCNVVARLSQHQSYAHGGLTFFGFMVHWCMKSLFQNST
jgi:hypothetical protein